MFIRGAFLRWLPDETRANQEFKSAVVRLAIGVFGSVYLGIALLGGYFALTPVGYFALLATFTVYAIAVVASIIHQPDHKLRRYAVLFTDLMFVTVASIMSGGADSPMYLLYILIFISQGGRFGRSYLFTAAAISFASYLVVCLSDPQWNHYRFESAFRLIALMILPLYLDAMLRMIQRAKQDADKANAAKSRFLATVSHEIRTPMSGAIGMINLLKSTPLTKEQQVYVNGLAVSSNSLHMLINDILDFSKIEAGKLVLENRPFQLSDVIDNTVTMLSPLAKQKGIELHWPESSEGTDRYSGDGYRIGQVLMNLAGNAIKFTDKGFVEITTLQLTTAHDGRVWVRVAIADTGIGIPKDKLAHIFDAFSQADVSTTRRYGGTGLGTSIAHELVKLMGGRIGATSIPQQGSTFWFEIPLHTVDTNAIAREALRQAHSQPKPMHQRPGMRILLAEDSDINALFIATLLREQGHTVDVASDGGQALDYLNTNNYRLVFMDMRMPVMDGLEVTRRLRARESGGQTVPVIALTANATEDDRAQCLAAGMNAFLTKPVTPERLSEVVSNYAGGDDDTAPAQLSPPRTAP